MNRQWLPSTRWRSAMCKSPADLYNRGKQVWDFLSTSKTWSSLRAVGPTLRPVGLGSTSRRRGRKLGQVRDGWLCRRSNLLMVSGFRCQGSVTSRFQVSGFRCQELHNKTWTLTSWASNKAYFWDSRLRCFPSGVICSNVFTNPFNIHKKLAITSSCFLTPDTWNLTPFYAWHLKPERSWQR